MPGSYNRRSESGRACSRPAATAFPDTSSPEESDCADCTPTRKTLCPAAIMSPETQPNPLDSLVIDERAVGASQVAQLALGRIDLNHEVIAREGHVLRHRTMHVPRAADDERVVTLEDEGATFLRTFQYIQNHTHRIVPPDSRRSFDCRRYLTPTCAVAGNETVHSKCYVPSFAVSRSSTALDAKNVALAGKKTESTVLDPCNQSSCKRAIKHERLKPREGR